MDITGKKFLVTGGFGLIGSHIADRLLEEGAGQVILFDNGAIGESRVVSHLNGHPRVRFVQGDILTLSQLYDAMEGVHGVFHTAFFITIPLSRNIWLGMDVNIRGLMNILEVCRMRQVGKIIYSSSISVYGNTSTEVVSEDTAYTWTGVQPAAGLYGAGKIISEHLCRHYAKQYGLDFVALRISSVYGDRQHARGVNIMPIIQAYEQLRRGEAPVIGVDADEVHDYVYVGDVARAQVMAMHSDLSGEAFNITDGKSTDYRTLINTVLSVCGSDLVPRFEPDANRIKSASVTQNRFDIGKARDKLGWEPTTPLSEGIRRLIDWHERNERSQEKVA